MHFNNLLSSSFCLKSGMDASVAMKPKKIKVFSRLEDIVITNVDPKTIHKKVMCCADCKQTKRPSPLSYLMAAL